MLLPLKGLTANQRAAKLKELRPKMIAFLTNRCSCPTERKGLEMLNNETLAILLRNAKPDSSNADQTGSGSVQAGDEEDSDDHDYESKEGQGLDDGTEVGDAHIKGHEYNANRLCKQLFGLDAGAVRAAVQYTANQEKQARVAIINQLTANSVSDEARRAAWKVYARMDLPTLRQLAAAMPPTFNRQQEFEQQPLYNSYLGAAGGPPDLQTNREPDDPDDILPLPTANWDESASPALVKARQQQA